jgi:hypothetical protein
LGNTSFFLDLIWSVCCGSWILLQKMQDSRPATLPASYFGALGNTSFWT